MFKGSLYTFLILSISGGLLSLLGSVGIFISLIVQRRLDRLQDILEEFINLSYRSEVNLTGQMYNLIEKYQMHYIFPQRPRYMILHYIDLNIIFILILWAGAVLINVQLPFSPLFLIQLMPLLIGIYAALFFRHLLRNTINLENPLLETIIPAPTKLRSISYLSHFINLSVKSILKQARLTLHLQLPEEGNRIKVCLKEELSFDDFFYYIIISGGENPLFVSFGEIRFHFPPDSITGKPVPACRNLNIPLGDFAYLQLPDELEAKFLVFTRGEKHPIQYDFELVKCTSFFSLQTNPEMTINHQILYAVEHNILNILECNVNYPFFSELSPFFKFDGERRFIDLQELTGGDFLNSIRHYRDNVFID